MDMVSLLRTTGGLGVVLGVLAAALWVVRRYDLRLPGRAIGAIDRRLELVETLSIDARRTVALVRHDGREHVILIAPEGHLVLETGVVRDAAELAADEARRKARAEAQTLLDQQRAWQHELRATARKAAIERLITAAKRIYSDTIHFIEARKAVSNGTFALQPEPAPPRSTGHSAATAYARPSTKRARRRRQIREKQVA